MEEEKKVLKLPRKARDNSLTNLLKPQQSRVQRMRSGSGTRAQLQNSFVQQTEEDEDAPIDPLQEEAATNSPSDNQQRTGDKVRVVKMQQ